MISEQAAAASSMSMVSPPTVSSVHTLSSRHPTDSRIDPQNIPRPIYSEKPITCEGGRIIETDKFTSPCSSSLLCSYIDRGNASPKYIRSSLSQIPQCKQTLVTSKIPFVLLVNVFPCLNECESVVPVTDLSRYSQVYKQISHNSGTQDTNSQRPHNQYESNDGPVRCPRCGAYVNCFTRVSGSICVCNLCDSEFQIPEYYAVALNEYQCMSGGQSLLQGPDETAWIRYESFCGVVDHRVSNIPHSCLRQRQHHLPSPAVSGVSSSIVDENNSNNNLSGGGQYGCHPMTMTTLPSRPVIRQAIVALVELSVNSFRTQFFSSVLTSLRSAVSSWIDSYDVVDISIVGYNEKVFFFPYRPTTRDQIRTSGFHIVTVSDVEAPFCPCAPNSIFHTVNSKDPSSKDSLLRLIDFLAQINDPDTLSCQNVSENLAPPPNYHSPVGSCLFSALACAVELLSVRASEPNSFPIFRRGGNVLLFTASSSTCGLGHELDPHHPNSDTTGSALWSAATGGEGSSGSRATVASASPLVLHPQIAEVVQGFIDQCVSNAVCIDSFVAGDVKLGNNDIYALTRLSAQTGGKIRHYPKFNVHRGGYHQLYWDVQRLLVIPCGFDCSLKLRVTKGFSVQRILCPWSSLTTESGGHGRDASAFSIPKLDGDTTMCFELSHEDGLPANAKFVHVQVACMYTSRDGSRLLRTCTSRLGVTQSLNIAFRGGDVDTMCVFLARYACLSMLRLESNWRDQLISQLTDILHSYRLNAALNSPSGQLILPESLKLLPVYLAGLFKHITARPVSTRLQTDEKIAMYLNMLSVPPNQLGTLLYPRIYPIHFSSPMSRQQPVPPRKQGISSTGESFEDRLSRVGLHFGNDKFYYVPPSISASGDRLTTDGIFVLDNGLQYYIYIGGAVTQEDRESALGVQSLQMLYTSGYCPFDRLGAESRPESLGYRIANVISQLRFEKRECPYQHEEVILAGSPEESTFIWHLVEDRLGSETSYVDFLCQLHQTVKNMLEDS